MLHLPIYILFVDVTIMGNQIFAQHITGDNGGMVTQFCSQETLCAAKYINVAIGSKIFFHIWSIVWSILQVWWSCSD